MDSYTIFIIARILHILGVILIPALRREKDPDERLNIFETLEGRFSLQAKFVTAITGLSGFYMIDSLDAWGRYLDISFWWVHMMTIVWLIFSVVLFILEPLFLHRWFHEKAKKDSEKSFLILHNMHKVLLALSLIAIIGAVGGIRGFL